MEFIAHRINTIEDLKQVPTEYGVEIDLRDFGERLVLQHDPFKDGQEFEEYLKCYKHGTMILNIKSERIEFMALELVKMYRIRKYFLLDSSFPMIYHLSKNGEKNIALRFSEYEGLDTILNMAGKVGWVWVDCFNDFPLTLEAYQKIKSHFKICLVSPELQNHSLELIKTFKSYLKDFKFEIDAVCTKRPELWKAI